MNILMAPILSETRNKGENVGSGGSGSILTCAMATGCPLIGQEEYAAFIK